MIRVYCVICGAHTINKEAIEKVKNNVCPVCLTVGSLAIKTETKNKEKN